MVSSKLKAVPRKLPGVYCMFDLDGRPAYGGKSGGIRSRLRQHFVRQDSSVVSYGRLDVWDISHVYWWETDEYTVAEQHLLDHYTPYLNFLDDAELPDQACPIDFDTPDGVLRLIGEEERSFRSKSYNRSKQKLEHISRMVDKIRFAGHSDDTKRTLYAHYRILEEEMSEFLGLDGETLQSELEEFSD